MKNFVVGTTTMSVTSTSDPQDYTIPMPAATRVGDVLALCLYGARGYVVTDARLTPTPYPPAAQYPESGSHAGAWGIATDLTDVSFTSHGFMPGNVVLIALRGVRKLGEPVAVAGYSYPPDTDVIVDGDLAGNAALVAVADFRQHSTYPAPPWNTIEPIGDAVGWAVVDEARWDPRRAPYDDDLSVKVFVKVSGPLALTASFDTTMGHYGPTTFDRAWWALSWSWSRVSATPPPDTRVWHLAWESDPA